MDEIWESLKIHRVQIVQQLRVDRSLLFDHLRSKGVFDSEDCELVNAEKTKELFINAAFPCSFLERSLSV